MLEIQKQLREGKTPAEICEPLGINFKELDEKFIFSYDMIDSYKFKQNPIVRECRGLILYKSDWNIAAYPFSRFFNYGETGADELPGDLVGCSVLEKLDGTMIALRFDRITEKWEVSTRNMIYAEGPVNNCDTKTFAQLFWEAVKNTKLPYLLDKNLLNIHNTYVFELTSPENRIVTPYKDTKATLITGRNNETLDEFYRPDLITTAEIMQCELVREIPMKNWEALLQMEALNPTFEGYVVIKQNFAGSHSRVKVKNPAYLQIAKLCSSISDRAFMELIKIGKQDDYLSIYPEYANHVEKLMGGLHEIINIVRADWIEISGNIVDPKNRKEFAIDAVKRKFPQLLFSLYDNKVCMHGMFEYLINLRTDSLLQMIEGLKK